MPSLPSPLTDVTTINYTLSWPHLENPSNTTFAGATQIDICRCGPNNIDLGHVYTRYRCPRPEIHFAPPNEKLWVLQAPLGQVNLLGPANEDEIRRRSEIHATNPTAYAGKNLLLLSGPCPRGRYQAFATLQFLKSLPLAARQNVECLSILIQPYEEDCSDDAGGRAYIDLARYILEELPGFKTLCLNIWGEETRAGSREFAMVLWREGVSIVVSWDWWTGETEKYLDVEGFLRGVDGGVVKERLVWGVMQDGDEVGVDRGQQVEGSLTPRSYDYGTLAMLNLNSSGSAWEDTSEDEDEGSGEEHQTQRPDGAGTHIVSPLEAHTNQTASLEEGWSDSMLTPLSPNSLYDSASWQIL